MRGQTALALGAVSPYLGRRESWSMRLLSHRRHFQSAILNGLPYLPSLTHHLLAFIAMIIIGTSPVELLALPAAVAVSTAASAILTPVALQGRPTATARVAYFSKLGPNLFRHRHSLCARLYARLVCIGAYGASDGLFCVSYQVNPVDLEEEDGWNHISTH